MVHVVVRVCVACKRKRSVLPFEEGRFYIVCIRLTWLKLTSWQVQSLKRKCYLEYGPPLLELRFVLAGRRLVIDGCAARHVGPRTVEASDRVPAAASTCGVPR